MNKFTKIVIAGLMACSMAACGTDTSVKEPETPKQTADVVEVEETPVEENNLLGSWQRTSDETVTEELKAKYYAAVGEDYEYAPVTVEAVQFVSGTNYLFVCEDSEGNRKAIGVYENTDGECSMLDDSMLPQDLVSEVLGTSVDTEVEVLPEESGTVSEESGTVDSPEAGSEQPTTSVEGN